MTLFQWGQANGKWGNTCAAKLAYNMHFFRCEHGNKLECTFVNQQQSVIKP